jgi:hypothetical protein
MCDGLHMAIYLGIDPDLLERSLRVGELGREPR